MNNHTPIKKLFHQWMEAQQANRKWKSLIGKRDELHNEILQRTECLDADILHLHQKNTYKSESNKTTTSQIEDDQKILSLLKDKLQEVDQRLDELEQSTDEEIANLQAKMIEEILITHPQEKERHDFIEKEMNDQLAKQHELHYVCQICNDLIAILNEVLAVRDQVKRSVLISYIFGRNPNIAISKYLDDAKKYCSVVQPQMEEIAYYGKINELQETYRNNLDFLMEFAKHCGQRWGFRQIDTTFVSARNKFQEFLLTYEKHLYLVQENRKRAIANREEWIKGFV